MIDLNEVSAAVTGVAPSGVSVRFGLYLPGLDPASYRVVVRVIHHDDRMVPGILPIDIDLAGVPGHPLGLWQKQAKIPVTAKTNFGKAGRYLYRYMLLRRGQAGAADQVVVRWFTDPFAKATDYVGQLSAFDTSPPDANFAWGDPAWKTPGVDDLVVLELDVEEFNSGFEGVAERLPYLLGLGINCLELMPVTSFKLGFDWGYGPLHFFAPNERWGGALGLKRLVDACHRNGVAVILDVVYQHVDVSFPYELVYQQAGLPSPMIRGQGQFGPEIDYQQQFAQDYVQVVGSRWLHEFHVDGFRYDEITDLYRSPTDTGYAKMAYDAYNESLGIARFTPSGGRAAGEYSRLIQCAEALWRATEVVSNTYSSSAWTDELMAKSESLAAGAVVDDALAHILVGFTGFPSTKSVRDSAGRGLDMPVAPFQYLASHDHSPLVAFASGQGSDVLADRSRWYKTQPYVIALYTLQGVPMLWQGQEFADNSVLPSSGDARVHYRRDVHWEFFYDDFGGPLIRLHRILGRLRRSVPALRGRDSYYYNVDSRPAAGLIAYHRRIAGTDQTAMVVLNFSDQTGSLSVPFPDPGTYVEMVDADTRAVPYELVVDRAGQVLEVTVPPNYGCVFVRG